MIGKTINASASIQVNYTRHRSAPVRIRQIDTLHRAALVLYSRIHLSAVW